MCTLSIIPIQVGSDIGIRLVFNRDERRARPAAAPPQQRRFGERAALLPIDAVSGGTWIAVNDAGLAMMLLNVNPPAAALHASPSLSLPTSPRKSRGHIIPALLHQSTVDAAVQQALSLRAADYPAFRLIIASTCGSIELASDGSVIRCGAAVLPGRLGMFTSSGLGDHRVDPPRRKLFEQMLGDGRHCPRTQDAFHQHQWPDRAHLSVNMIRPDARTVSRAIVELTGDRASMTYASLDENGGEFDRSAHSLDLAPLCPRAGMS